MLGLMQQRPLLISNIVDYVATWHAKTEIVSRDPQGVIHRQALQDISREKPHRQTVTGAVGIDHRHAGLGFNFREGSHVLEPPL